jgi:esterase
VQLHFRKYGSGPPLIILHGLFGSLTNWHSHAQWFGEWFTVYGVDLRNHGHSPHDPLHTYGVMALDIQEFMVDQGIDRARFLGHSMGGKVAMQFAGMSGRQVEGLVAVDIAPRGYKERHNLFLDGMSSLRLERYSTRDEVEEAFSRFVVDARVRQFLMTNLRRTIRGFEWKINIEAIRANYSAIMGEVSISEPFAGPALFLRGGRSDYLVDEDIPAIRMMFPQAEFASVADAGHWVHAEAPGEFRKVVGEFLLHRPSPGDIDR